MDITATLSAKHADKLTRLEAHFGMTRNQMIEFMLDRIYDVNAIDIGHFHWSRPRKVRIAMDICYLCKQPLEVGQRACDAEANNEDGPSITAHYDCTKAL